MRLGPSTENDTSNAARKDTDQKTIGHIDKSLHTHFAAPPKSRFHAETVADARPDIKMDLPPRFLDSRPVAHGAACLGAFVGLPQLDLRMRRLVIQRHGQFRSSGEAPRLAARYS
ncbi:hypothetical protein EYF88_05880 [Paracoccus sediminis]|uniref:Uncharacterized protein n=1 Tax=Paracoccus sediminis TaxID=1214787 RepID=A0ABY1YMK5_9RHOB|nr:hypothetical protein EYF88_05880 [Paracoccus sediminis]